MTKHPSRPQSKTGIGSTLTLVLVLASLIMLSPASHADYVAYTEIGGELRPLPEHVDRLEPKRLLHLRWGKYAGKRTRVGVLPVENNSTTRTTRVTGPDGKVTYRSQDGRGVPVQGIEAIFTTVMKQSGRFRLIERKALDEALDEQDLGRSGRVADPSAARTGKVLGAQYLLHAVITHYEAGVEQSDMGAVGGLIGGRFGGLVGSIKSSTSKAVLGMNCRLINAETSEVEFSTQIEVSTKKSSTSFGGLGGGHDGGMGGFIASYAKTPIGQAVIASVNRCVFEMVKKAGNAPATGSVIKVVKNRVLLNLGQEKVRKGEQLDILQTGAPLIDPETGVDLGSEEERIGALRVIAVKPKYSIAKPMGISAKDIKRGDKVVSTRMPEPMQFADPEEFGHPVKRGRDRADREPAREERRRDRDDRRNGSDDNLGLDF